MKTAKLNKSEILKNAWMLFKTCEKTSQMFSNCLKLAWFYAKNPSNVMNEIKAELKPIEVIKPIEVVKPVNNLDFNQIYKDNYKYVCNVIKSKTNNNNDIDLIANDVFLQVYNVLSTIKTDKDIKPFLFQIAKNKLVDFYRKEVRHSYQTTDKVSDYVDDKGNEYMPTIAPNSYNANQIENNEINERLENEISKLNDNVGKCIKMFLDGYQYDEIAEILNMPINSVGVYVNRAKKALHKTMKNEYDLYKA